jgi:hypothetical protein
MNVIRSSSACPPPPTPRIEIRPPRARLARSPAKFGPPMSSSTTSNGPRASKPSGLMTSTPAPPSSATAPRNASLRTVAVTRAPARAASCTPAMPTPPAAPWTRTCSPSVSPHWLNRASWAVVNTSGKPPASGHGNPSGTGSASRSGTIASSAWPPPATTAITRSPVSKCWAPGPATTTSPAISRPGTSAGAPGGAGYNPIRWNMSGPFSPAARTATSSSPVPGSGSGCSRHSRWPSTIVTARTGRK